MKKNLVLSYVDDYNVSNVGCIDLTIATYLGYFNREDYYNYCFLYACMSNWKISEKVNDLTEQRELILNELGIELINIEINNENELFNVIKSCINKDKPILLPTKYRSLFYYKNYLDENEKGNSILIITGYNDTPRMYQIEDMTIARSVLSSYFSGEVYIPLQLKASMMSEIITLNKEYADNLDKSLVMYAEFKEVRTPFTKNKKYQYLKHVIENKKDLLAETVANFNNMLTNEGSIRKFDIILIKRYIGSMTVISNFIKECLSNKRKYVDSILEEYMKTRRRIVNKLIKIHLAESLLTLNQQQEMIYSIEHQNNLILQLLDSIPIESKNEEEHNLLNDAAITADSELRSIKLILDKNKNSMNDYWVSFANKNEHWIKIELKGKSCISKICIYHMDKSELCTREYQILVSDNDDNWRLLEHVQNKKFISEHCFKNINCRFVKILILNPNMIDNYARIKKVTIN